MNPKCLLPYSQHWPQRLRAGRIWALLPPGHAPQWILNKYSQMYNARRLHMYGFLCGNIDTNIVSIINAGMWNGILSIFLSNSVKFWGSIVTGCGLDGRGIWVRLSAGQEIFLLSVAPRRDSGAHLVSCLMGTGGSFPRGVKLTTHLHLGLRV
jgi:hypothetical protein